MVLLCVCETHLLPCNYLISVAWALFLFDIVFVLFFFELMMVTFTYEQMGIMKLNLECHGVQDSWDPSIVPILRYHLSCCL